MRIYLLKLCNKILDLHSFGNTGSICTTGSTGIGKLAGTLDKMQVIVISPVLDICLPDQIHRADQLHPFEVCAVEFRHHGLYLCSIKHSHQDGLNHIIIVMSKGDLVASKFFCLAVKISSPHTGAEITRRFFHIVNCIKNLSLKYCDRDSEKLGVVFDHRTVGLIISRIHHKKYQFKRKLVMTFQLLEQFGHQHGILTTGNTDRDLVSRLHQFIVVDSSGESGKQLLVELLADTQLDIFPALFHCFIFLFFTVPFIGLFPHLLEKPACISALQAQCGNSFFPEHPCPFLAEKSSGTVKNRNLIPFQFFCPFFQFLLRNRNRSRDHSIFHSYFITGIYQKIFFPFLLYFIKRNLQCFFTHAVFIPFLTAPP